MDVRVETAGAGIAVTVAALTPFTQSKRVDGEHRVRVDEDDPHAGPTGASSTMSASSTGATAAAVATVTSDLVTRTAGATAAATAAGSTASTVSAGTAQSRGDRRQAQGRIGTHDPDGERATAADPGCARSTAAAASATAAARSTDVV